MKSISTMNVSNSFIQWTSQIVNDCICWLNRKQHVNSIQTRTEMTARCQRGESSWLLLNRESRQLWWSLHHFRDNGMLEIGSGQHVKFIGEFQTLVQCLRHGFGLRQEICPQDIKGCSTASLLIYLFHISSDLRWCKRANRTQKIRDFIHKMV